MLRLASEMVGDEEKTRVARAIMEVFIFSTVFLFRSADDLFCGLDFASFLPNIVIAGVLNESRSMPKRDR
jgi:hypothetical protein